MRHHFTRARVQSLCPAARPTLKPRPQSAVAHMLLLLLKCWELLIVRASQHMWQCCCHSVKRISRNSTRVRSYVQQLGSFTSPAHLQVLIVRQPLPPALLPVAGLAQHIHLPCT